jgi:ketosteroid isomerase-like protein
VNARPQTVEWLERYYRLLDENRVREAMAEFLTDGCTFRFGNAEPVGFLEEARRMSKLITGVRHRILTVLEDDDGTLACELEVTYIRHDGTAITLPGSLFARVRDGRFTEQRAYIDHGPLMA